MSGEQQLTASVSPRAGADPDASIDIRGVRQTFGDVVALDGIDLSIAPHTRLGIVGPSGCGKSTLLSDIAGLLEPDDGTITIGAARAPRERLARCALMPQKDLLVPWRTALDNACLALENRGASRKAARERARPLFERFGLGEFEERTPAELSGGMRQRVAFLRTLLPGRPVLLLDEPFGGLDSLTRSSMQRWLADALAQEPRTVLLVTHDVEEAVFLADRIAVLSSRPGRVIAEIIVELARPRDVTSPEFGRVKRRVLEALGL